jgi:hypothetical protein
VEELMNSEEEEADGAADAVAAWAAAARGQQLPNDGADDDDGDLEDGMGLESEDQEEEVAGDSVAEAHPCCMAAMSGGPSTSSDFEPMHSVSGVMKVCMTTAVKSAG